MARRPKKNDIPKKMAKQTNVFQGDGKKKGFSPHITNHNRVVGDPQSGLTTNRSKPGGGPGSSGPITKVS